MIVNNINIQTREIVISKTHGPLVLVINESCGLG